MEYVNKMLTGKFFKDDASDECKIEGLGVQKCFDKSRDIVISYIKVADNNRTMMYFDEFLLKGYKIYEKEEK